MKKSGKYLLTILVTAAALTAGVFAFQYYQKNKSPAADRAFDQLQVSVSAPSDLAKTDFDTIFYAQSTGLFYQWDGTSFVEYPQEVRNISLTLFGQALAFDLHLAQQDGRYFGFGRVDSVLTDFFVKAVNTPACNIGNKQFDPADTLLILLDATQGNIPQEDRVYSDAFVYRLSTGDVLQQYLDDRLRPVTEAGVKRLDYFGFTTEMIQRATSVRMHFLTRAVYEQTDDPYRLYDLESTEPSYYYAGYDGHARTLTDIILGYAYDTDGGIFHFKRGDSVFYSKIGTGAPEDQTICTFQGDYLKDYVRQGDYLVHTGEFLQGANFTVTNARTGDAQKIQAAYSYREITSVKMNEAQNRLVLLGEFDWTTPKGETCNLQLVTFVNLSTGKTVQYAGTSLYDVASPSILFSGTSAFLHCDGSLCQFDI